MRVALLIWALLASALAFSNLEHNNGYEVLKELEAGNHNVYIIMFYAGAAEGSALYSRNNDYEETLTSRVLESYGGFFYTKVDARNQDYAELVDALGVNTQELQKSPSVLIMEHGNGAWIHGPETISKIAEYAPAYSQRSENA